MKILLLLIALIPSLCLSKIVTYHGYKVDIPDEYNIIISDLSDDKYFSDNKFILVRGGGETVLGIKTQKKLSAHELKEYGVTSRRELNYIVFNDDVPLTNKNILKVREINKNFPLQKQSISEDKDKDFVFFRMDNAMDLIGVTILVSTPIKDEILKFSFLGEPNEKFIKKVIDSLEVK